ncbi:helix-turn-helix domain-containing protein [Ktedonobacter robiniae]|uniref:HTH araC/xylS-type domain-containing protein n=1 Tax=Ktedonobacter robiniae TaxID=2778365 RepID=A0ABQ3V705_9CHLR|nr:helix-turn-helix domain-containing protein [Ktedonobacter robiniae]GHO60557.1 hypothetical protein KSB_90320 [Ktedonobacter robiniae]
MADRFHVVSNLVEYLDRLITRQWQDICRTLVPPPSIHPGEVLPSYSSTSSPRFRTMAAPDDLLEALRTAYQCGTRVISFCTGAFLLAAAGLLDGRRATTHWAWAAELAARYPKVQVNPRVLYVDDNQVLTAAGTAAAIDLSLYIVRQDYGAEIAAAVARRMVVPLHATLGMTPYQWILQQRIVLAQRLLETTNKPVEQIAPCCGFHSAATLRLHFQRFLRISPQAYRHTSQQKQGERRIEYDPGDK